MGNNSIFTEELRSRQNRYFSTDIKKKVVRDLEKNLHTISDVCKAYQVSRTSVYRWIFKYSAMAKKQHKQVIEAKSETKRIRALEEMNEIYRCLKISKQSFHQMLNRRMYKQEEEEQIVHLVRQIRKDHPRMSARDIYQKVQPSTIGRDQFEQVCYNNGLRVQQKKNFRKTTDSTGVTRFPNHLKGIEVTGVNQAFVSDITYYEMEDRFYYLTFIMDLYNREIVGYSASDNMRTENTTLPALNKLIRLRGSENLKGSIFHSDGGGQYYSNEFKAVTGDLEMINSMAEEVFENPHAERLNGIIKNNYLYPYGPTDFKSLKKSLKKAVWMYNNEKPHSSLQGNTPINYIKKVGKTVNAIQA